MADNIASLVDRDGRELARLSIEDFQEDWYYATVMCHAFPEGLYRALQWYDEIVADQLLSYLDEALAVLNSFQLRIAIEGKMHPVYSLRISADRDASFRITPVPLPQPAHTFANDLPYTP